MKHTLQIQRAIPQIPNFGKIVPIERSVQLVADEFSDPHFTVILGIGFHRAEPGPAVQQGTDRPFRTQHTLPNHPRGKA